MKKALLFTFVLLLLSIPAEAQMRWGVRGGLTDGEPMIGGDFAYPIFGDFVLNPSIEFTSELFSANADVHYDIDVTNNSSFWVGAGLAFLNPDEGDIDGGVNLLGGYGMQRGRWYPYAQVRLTSGGDIDNFTSFQVGVRF